MVAASKLRRAQEQAEAARPYRRAHGEDAGQPRRPASRTSKARRRCSPAPAGTRSICWSSPPPTAACAAASTARSRAAPGDASASCAAQGKKVKVLCVGRKGRDKLRREFGDADRRHHRGPRPARGWSSPRRRRSRERLERMYEAGEFDVCTIVFNRFQSAITQILTFQQLIPVEPPPSRRRGRGRGRGAVYEFEPDEADDPGRPAAAQPRRADLSARCWRTRRASRARA